MAKISRLIAASLALIPLDSACVHAWELGGPGSCPRPTDQYAPPNQIVTGTYRSRGVTQGGGEYVTIILNGSLKPPYPVSERSVPVSGGVFSAAGMLRPGTRITLVGYVGYSMSRAMPPIAVSS
jgi:hypothetical protein